MDGSVGTGSTTLSADSLKGTDTITLTATTNFGVGSGITVGTSVQIYSITDITGSVATISPSLPFDVSSGDAVLELGQTLEVKVGEGTLTYSEKRGVVYVLNRGKIYTVKLGDDAPVEVSLQFIWEFLRAGSGDPPTVEEALKNIGAASAWVSASSDPCEPYSVKMIICNLPPCPGDAEVIELTDFRWETLDHDLKAGQVSTKGNCNIAFANVTHTG